MVRNTLSDYDRVTPNFNQPRVVDIVPEHFLEQYPKLVGLLETYYEWMHQWQDSDGRMAMGEFEDINYIKDREVVPERFIDYMYNEAINGLSPDNFDLPRYTLKLLPFFYKSKGTVVASQGFFRFLYGIDPDFEYPKNDMFIVGQSEIGAESLKVIQDSYFYQIFSVLIKSELPYSKWGRIYKQYMHPAGFALFAETLFESVISNASMTSPSDSTITKFNHNTESTISFVFDGFASSYLKT